ncbi:MFS transporter [Streptomyces sp. KhCrAH-43]|uniref:MFS transporter n=1 Tax=unclassified Streptomyces TaxID=2593676 RepID=UPI000362E7C6|nr:MULTISPECIES: MFS transporter [unclassified Streptomyces]MYS33321.1 MFS transporter [Streptomyces sp. SID4920]MYX67480.1 MFS transporter [Streptomyces sp. SID8373]RAJ57877.1 MFS transporter [Streptomyces sp. KhCrAH-43]
MYVADSRTGTPEAPAAAPSAASAARPLAGRRRPAVAPTVLALGAVSLITDVSSEMVTAVLPLYLVAGLGLSPLGFGLLDGIYNGFSALVRLVGGHLADRGGGRHKWVAGAGYALSAACKPLLLVAQTLTPIGLILAADRTGKGLRTAPRDALISLSSTPESRGRAFGVHRAMDTAGALLGPLVAFLILRATVDGYDAVFTVSFCVAVVGVLVLVLFVPGGAGTKSGVVRPAGADADTGRAAEPGANAGHVGGLSTSAAAGHFGRLSTSAAAGRAGKPGAEARALPAPAPRPTLRAALALLHRPELRRITVCALLLGLATVSDSFVFLLLQRRLGVPDRWFALLPLGTAAAFLLLAVPLGRLADRAGRWRVFLGGHGALLLAYALLLSSWQGSATACAVLLLHGGFYAATDGVLMAAASDSVPRELRSSGLALVQTGQALARFACSLGFGAAWTAWGDRTALTASVVLLALCAVFALCLRPIRPTTPSEGLV